MGPGWADKGYSHLKKKAAHTATQGRPKAGGGPGEARAAVASEAGAAVGMHLRHLAHVRQRKMEVHLREGHIAT